MGWSFQRSDAWGLVLAGGYFGGEVMPSPTRFAGLALRIIDGEDVNQPPPGSGYRSPDDQDSAFEEHLAAYTP
ncbi:hypothetical protein [Actinomadura miaoliensis]|uniref:hypothetical protein n=1 Tax=Actinomadura miaoliensis TaxID=430685 RepID=UPI0031E88D5C